MTDTQTDTQHPLLELKNGSHVDPATAFAFWQSLRRLYSRDEMKETAVALYELCHGGTADPQAEAELREGGWLDAAGDVLPIVQNVVRNAVTPPDAETGKFSVDLPFAPDNEDAARVWATRIAQQQISFAQLVTDIRDQRGTGERPKR